MDRDFRFYGYVFLLSGSLLLFHSFLIFNFYLESLIGAIFVVVGLRLFYNNYGSEKKFVFMLGNTLFFFGVLLFVSSEFMVRIDGNLILFTLFLSLSAGFLFLFLTDKNLGLLILTIGLLSSCILFAFIEIGFIEPDKTLYTIDSFEIMLALSILFILIGIIKLRDLRKSFQ
ncbi:MAG: hypothetical protein KJ666_04530 [Bacteroidetes bacterium]|nr:hypothetical protein [Bacteroidota bacterium]MBU2583871.1 hypothetical protein [Bacteroidota bacterium]